MAKKDRLGKGLDSLFSDNLFSEPGSNGEGGSSEDGSVSTVKLSLLEPNINQPRGNFDEEKLSELANSIKENGVLQPILVRPLDNGGYQIVAGERRWRAARLAGLGEVPVYIKELDDRQTMQMALIENIQRQDLSPLEESAAYQSLMDNYGMTQQQVAEAVGKSRSAIANSVRLLKLCEEVRTLVNEGVLSAGHGKVLAGLDADKQVLLANLAREQDLNVRQLEAKASELSQQEQQDGEQEQLVLQVSSVKKERPFLKEFEVAVNAQSNIRVKTKSEKDGGVSLNLKIGKESDIEAILAKLAELLANY